MEAFWQGFRHFGTEIFRNSARTRPVTPYTLFQNACVHGTACPQSAPRKKIQATRLAVNMTSRQSLNTTQSLWALLPTSLLAEVYKLILHRKPRTDSIFRRVCIQWHRSGA